MKKILVFITITLLSIKGYCQQGEWTWMNGDSTAGSSGHFGTQGVFDSLNTPPALYEACQWTDKEGNFWLYGGGHAGYGGYSDLWKFDPTINQWAWIKGPGGVNGQSPNLGVQGIPSPTNTPGGRFLGVMTWVDTSGNLWLFGGSTGFDIYNDLWVYSIATNEWTWMKGNNNGSYGTKGIEDTTNNPPPR